MNTWRDRLLIGLLLLAAQQAHAAVNDPLPNTRAWMLFYFGTAATLEYAICRYLPRKLEGRLCDDMQVMAFVCIVLDALGFLGYMTKTPSIYYNTVMWGISYVQWARLLFVDGDHARSFWNSLVRGFNSGRAKAYFKTATR